MRISIQVPVYNAEKYIIPCLRSILADMDEECELLVVDDCSTDNSAAIIRDFAMTDPRIRVEPNSRNLGEAGTRRRMVEMTDAELIVPFDADDIFLPGRLKRQAGIMTTLPEIAAVYGKTLLWDAAQGTVAYYTGRPLSNFLIFNGNPIGHGSVMMRRTALLEAGNYMEPFFGDQKSMVSCDFFMWMRLSLVGQMCFDDAFAYLYRVHGNQAVQTKTEQFAVAHRYIASFFKDKHLDCINALLRGEIKEGGWQVRAEQMQALGYLVRVFKEAGKPYLPMVMKAAQLDPADYGPMMCLYDDYIAANDFPAAISVAEFMQENWKNEPYVKMIALKMDSAALRKLGNDTVRQNAIDEELSALCAQVLGTEAEHLALLEKGLKHSRISLLIYTGKYDDSLCRTVASAVNCGCEVEILLVIENDADAFLPMAGRFPTVKIVLPDEPGIVAAMRKMFELSSGDYIMPLPSGVMLIPGAITELQKMLDTVPDSGGVYGLHVGYDAVARRLCFVEGGPVSYFRLFEGRNFPQGSIMMRRSAIIAAGGIYAMAPEFSHGWDYFLYYRLALAARWCFIQQPISYRKSPGERPNPFHHGKDCRNTLLENSAAIVVNRAREWFKTNHRELMQKIMSGEKFTGGNVPEIMTALGLIAEMTKPGSRDAETIITMAGKLMPGDYGPYWFDIDNRLKSGDWQGAIKQADEMFNRFYQDSWVGRKALNLKRKIMNNAGAPLEVMTAFDAATGDYLKTYYLTAETCRKLESWMTNCENKEMR